MLLTIIRYLKTIIQRRKYCRIGGQGMDFGEEMQDRAFKRWRGGKMLFRALPKLLWLYGKDFPNSHRSCSKSAMII